MDKYFTTQSVTKMFKVSHQTVKNWCREFAKYLSLTAQRPDGKKRVFSVEDMQVFALLAEYHKRGFGYDEAHAALTNGQRGELPEKEGEIVPTVPPALLVQLRDEIATRDRIITQLTTERDMERGKVQQLEKLLEERERKIEQLYRDNARLEADKD